VPAVRTGFLADLGRVLSARRLFSGAVMRVCVSGGDIVGLVVAHMCRVRGHSVVLIEHSMTLGQTAFLPTFKYLERTQEVLTLLDGLGIVYGEYTIATGLLERGSVAECPRKVSDAVHHANWRKTRLTAMPAGAVGLADPEVCSKRYAVSFDWRDFAKRLSAGLTVAHEMGVHARTADVVFETLPPWESRLVKQGSSRDAMAVALNMLPVRANKDRYLRWDVVYTPHTPGSAIHRLYHGEETGYVCEFSGVIAEDAVTSDLNYLFPEGWHVDGPISTTSGKLVDLQESPAWESKVRPIGRMAQWDEEISLTRVIREVAGRIRHADAR